MSGLWTEAEVPLPRVRPTPAADDWAETLCGPEGSERDTTRSRESQTEIRENPGQLQGKVITHPCTNRNLVPIHFTFFLSASACVPQASLKESELRLAEVRKAKKEFERRLLKPLKDNRVEMKEPDKVLQCIRDKLQVKKKKKGFGLMTSIWGNQYLKGNYSTF